MVGILDLKDYSDIELRQALNSWTIHQEPVPGYRPDHNYKTGVEPLNDAEYAFLLGQFFAEAHKRGIRSTSGELLTPGQRVFLIEGTYTCETTDDAKLILKLSDSEKILVKDFAFYVCE